MERKIMPYVTLVLLAMLLVGCNQNTALPTLAKLPTIVPSPTSTETPSSTPSPTATQTYTPTPSPTATLTAKREDTPILSNQSGHNYVEYSCPDGSEKPKIYLFDEEHEDWDEYIIVVANSICDVNHFWQQELGRRYKAPKYVAHINYTDDGETIAPKDVDVSCGKHSNVKFSARYCTDFTNPGIIIVKEISLEYYQLYGAIELTHTAAHEWAHHIQFIIWNDFDFSELQANCLFGAYARYAVDNPDIVQIPVITAEWEQFVNLYEAASDTLVYPIGADVGWDYLTYGHVADVMNLGFEGGVSACIETDFSISD